MISNSKDITEHFNLVRSGDYIHSYNISPSSNIPVVKLDNGERVLENMHWGFIPHWAKDTKIQPINAKSETVNSKPFFRSAFKKTRCLIPANGFYEWLRMDDHKQPYYFRLKDDELLAFAGLWDHWENPEGQSIDSCTIITTSANEIMEPIHNRMPVILDPVDYEEWLQHGGKDFLKPYAGEMVCYPVSTVVNNPRNNGKDLIEPIELE